MVVEALSYQKTLLRLLADFLVNNLSNGSWVLDSDTYGDFISDRFAVAAIVIM